MRPLSLADIHCDTAYELFERHQSFSDNSLSVSEKKAHGYQKYLQVAAIWSDKKLDDAAVLAMRDRAESIGNYEIVDAIDAHFANEDEM